MPVTVNLPKTSMFINTPIYSVNNTVVFGLRAEIIPPDQSDRILTINEQLEGKLDLLSNEIYGTPELWWVIAESNQIVDPMTEITAGTKLRIPTKTRVFNILS